MDIAFRKQFTVRGSRHCLEQNIQPCQNQLWYFDNCNSKLKPYKIQNVTVIENPKLENEDVAEDVAKAIEEAYGFSCYFGSLPYIRFIPFFDFLQVIFLAVAISAGLYK